MLGRRRRYVVELDGWTYGYVRRRLSQISALGEVSGDKWYVVDLPESISRVMTVEAPRRYADLVLRKQLQESGEFNEPVTVIPQWKRSRGYNSSEVFFTAVPTRVYNQACDRIDADEDAVLCFPLYTVLYQALRRIKPRDPVAVIFQHDRFADVIIGTRDSVMYANRCVAYDASEEQISFLWETVRGEIKAVEAEKKVQVNRVFLLSWVDQASEPAWPEESGCQVFAFEEENVTYNDEAHSISLFKALESLSPLGSTSSRGQKLMYLSRKIGPYLNVLFLALILILLGGWLSYEARSIFLESRVKRIESRIARVGLEAPKSGPAANFRDVQFLIKDLDYCRNAPSFKDVVNDVSEALSYGMKMKVFKLDYDKSGLNVEIYGRFDTSFESAYKGYENFLTVLRRKGYSVEKNRLETQVTSSQFLLTLRKAIP